MREPELFELIADDIRCLNTGELRVDVAVHVTGTASHAADAVELSCAGEGDTEVHAAEHTVCPVPSAPPARHPTPFPPAAWPAATRGRPDLGAVARQFRETLEEGTHGLALLCGPAAMMDTAEVALKGGSWIFGHPFLPAHCPPCGKVDVHREVFDL